VRATKARVDRRVRQLEGADAFFEHTGLVHHHLPRPGSIHLADLAGPLDIGLLRGCAKDTDASRMLFSLNRIRTIDMGEIEFVDDLGGQKMPPIPAGLRFVELVYGLVEPDHMLKMYQALLGGDQGGWDQWMCFSEGRKDKEFLEPDFENPGELMCVLGFAVSAQFVQEISWRVTLQTAGLPAIRLPITLLRAQKLFGVEPSLKTPWPRKRKPKANAEALESSSL